MNLSNAEKFVYLQHVLKEGPAKRLSGTGEHYAKAIECLKARYDHPCLTPESCQGDPGDSVPQGWEWEGAATSA